MIEALGKWIVTICVAVFFATAVQMILPDNSLKKYCNFVLGLIVFVVMITPIVNLFNKDIEITRLIEQSTMEVFSDSSRTNTNYEKYRNSNMDTTLMVFKDNLEKQCEEDLAKEFKGDEFSVTVDASYDSENGKVLINSISVAMNDGSVKRVEKVVIGKEKADPEDKQAEEISKHGAEVKKFISSYYDIDEELIYIYKTDQ